MSITPPGNTNLSGSANYNMLDDGSDIYWFHHRPDFENLHPTLYDNLISSASTSVEVWDPYFNEQKDHIIFTSVKSAVLIKILTTKGLDKSVTYLQNIYTEVKSTIPATKNVSFCIGAINRSLSEKKIWEFHDRFLILDRTRVYLVGASVEYNYKSIASSGIYRIGNDITANFIIEQFDKYWNQTTKYPSSVQLLHI